MSMNYRLLKQEPLGDGIKRIGYFLNAQAINHINELAENHPHEAVHELRKRFKELRALIRLIRDLLGENYSTENHFYRDLGREITNIRDLKAFIEALALLKDLYNRKLYKNAFSTTEAFLNDRLSSLAESMNLKETLLYIKSQLDEHASIIKEWPVQVESFKDISKSLRRVYERGYKMMGTIRSDASVEDFHELRKRSKYMRYHMDLISFIWPGMMNAEEQEFGKFSDLLGNDHDLALFLSQLSSEKPDEEEYQLLKAIINDKRAAIQQEVLELGAKLYAETPRVFIRRIGKYWLAQEKPYTAMDKIPQLNPSK
jgi:CHAD domain-containing protein